MKKRLFLIGLGTVGGLGSVLVISPPQLGSTKLLPPLGTLPVAQTPTQTPTQIPTQIPTQSPAQSPASTQTPMPVLTIKGGGGDDQGGGDDGSGRVSPNPIKTTPPTSTNQNTTVLAKTPVAVPTSKPTSKQVSGTFTGVSANTQYGPVQVQITIVNNKITKATALVYPNSSFRDQQINSQAIPYLVQETLVAQSANIQGVGGASYTSAGWQSSLASALSKAGL